MIKRVLWMAVLLSCTVIVGNAQKQVKQQFADVTEVNVSGIFCQINIDVSDHDKVDFEGQIEPASASDEYKILYKQTGTQLKVWVEAPKHYMGNVNGQLNFKVPRTTNVMVDNVSGSVKAKGLAGSSLVIKSVSGSLDLQSIQSNLRAETVSGSLLVNAIEGNLNASTVSGRVDVTQVGGTVNASSVSGSVKIRKVEGNANISSVSGSVEANEINSNTTVSCTSGSINAINIKGDIDCNNTSGSIRLQQVSGSIKAKTVSGSISGEGVDFTGNSYFNSMSGSVSIKCTNTDSALSFDLKSFSGKLEARGIVAKEKLKIEKGTIWIHGETFSGSQTYL
jgi:DUF4097 and DUF4098 domain-containing protein YvlB